MSHNIPVDLIRKQTRIILGRTQAYEDTSFVVGDSPATHDVLTDMGRASSDGYIRNDGAGDFTVAFSDDSTAFGSEHTLKSGETLSLEGLDIQQIRVTHVADSSYRILVV